MRNNVICMMFLWVDEILHTTMCKNRSHLKYLGNLAWPWWVIILIQSNPVISCTVDSWKSVTLTPWTPNFSGLPCLAVHMTYPVTHMCWSEQISPLAHSLQVTWQPFNHSHCIEMHNTHLLGYVGQLNQLYFTYLALILTLCNHILTIKLQWLPL